MTTTTKSEFAQEWQHAGVPRDAELIAAAEIWGDGHRVLVVGWVWWDAEARATDSHLIHVLDADGYRCLRSDTQHRGDYALHAEWERRRDVERRVRTEGYRAGCECSWPVGVLP